jgi:hypothetical protein
MYSSFHFKVHRLQRWMRHRHIRQRRRIGRSVRLRGYHRSQSACQTHWLYRHRALSCRNRKLIAWQSQLSHRCTSDPAASEKAMPEHRTSPQNPAVVNATVPLQRGRQYNAYPVAPEVPVPVHRKCSSPKREHWKWQRPLRLHSLHLKGPRLSQAAFKVQLRQDEHVLL